MLVGQDRCYWVWQAIKNWLSWVLKICKDRGRERRWKDRGEWEWGKRKASVEQGWVGKNIVWQDKFYHKCDEKSGVMWGMVGWEVYKQVEQVSK